MPTVRLIVLLRDPVERAHSHFRLQKRAGIERLATFEEALEAEPARLEGEREKMATQPDYYSYNFQHYSYLARGVYQPQLAAWMEHFPREQFLVLPSERFYAQPEATFGRVCDFLGLPSDPKLGGDPPRLNHQPGEEMKAETRRWLQRYFAPHNAELARYLGQEFGW